MFRSVDDFDPTAGGRFFSVAFDALTLKSRKKSKIAPGKRRWLKAPISTATIGVPSSAHAPRKEAYGAGPAGGAGHP